MGPRTLLYVIVVVLSWGIFWRQTTPASRQTLLLIVSYLLYASWGITFLGLLVFSSLVNYAWGAALARRPTRARLWGAVLFNVLLLCTFKYLPGMAAHVPPAWGALRLADLVLPVGISFWTFQALSYVIDVYQGREVDPSLREFLLYMAFWPTVLSGPISRLSQLLPQFRAVAPHSSEDTRVGLDRIAIGLFMTAVGRALANGVQGGIGIESVFTAATPGLTGPDVWCLAIGYGFELFFNFAGYSHLVIGAARLFGFRLDENFARPYLARTPSEFWTRWHMSLSFWIRDYVFLPLAVMRREIWWRNVALVGSMVLFGIWHNATLPLLLWGCYHGCVLVLHRQGQQLERRAGLRVIPAPVAWLLTFAVISLGWIFFRADTVTFAWALWKAALNPFTYSGHALPSGLYVEVFAAAAAYFCVAVLSAFWRHGGLGARVPVEARAALYAVAAYAAVLHTAETQSFIYFHF